MAKQNKAKTTESSEMYLYGIIGREMDIDTNKLIADIEAKRKEGVRSFTFYVNSDGGEVAQGSALFNYLDRTDVDITWVVDGIAASMMAVLITNPKHHVKAARHAKFMYHRVSGYVYGNSDETRAAADMMDSFEKTLIEMMASRINKSADETRNLYFDGVDHWLSAEEAVAAGLCDEIVNTNMNIRELENVTDARSAFNFYNNQIINLKQQKMDEKAFAAALNISETSTEAEILAGVRTAVNERTQLSQQLQAEKDKVASLENRVKEFEKSKVKALVDSAIADKRISEEDREAYTKLAEQDYENTEKVLNRMKPVERVKNQLEKGSVAKDEADWDWDKYHRSGKLENLKQNNPARYAELYEAKFGHKLEN